MEIGKMISVFVDGIATFVSPCLLPLLPIYILYLTGTSIESYDKDRVDKRRLLMNALGFIIGFTAVFVALGALASSLGQFLKDHREIVRIGSGVVIILFGLSFLGVLRLRIFDMEKRVNYEVKQLRFLSAIVFGMAFGFAWTPCGSKYLGFALALAASSNTLLQGTLLLFIYSMGLGIPLLITALLFDKLKGVFTAILKYTGIINKISGILLILAGILLIFDKLSFLTLT